MEVLSSYDHNNKPSAKVKQAIAACRKEIETAHKKIEDKHMGKKETKVKSEEQSVETLQSASNAKVKKTKGLKKLSKKQAWPSPNDDIKYKSNLANQYFLDNTRKQGIESNPVMHEFDKK